MKFTALIFAFFLLLPSAVVNASSVYENCKIATFDKDLLCTGAKQSCTDISKFKISLTQGGAPISNACLPDKYYDLCNKGVSCTKTGTDTDCATLVSISDPKKYGTACLTVLDVPKDYEKTNNNCSTNTDCVVGTGNKQCVEVIYNASLGKFLTARRCIDIEKLPAAVLDADKGSCGQNAVCTPTQSCVENTFEVSSVKSYVCYAKSNISTTLCGAAADKCTFDQKTGICMNILEAGKKILRCVDPTLLPNAQNSPSTQICNSDSNCKSEVGAKYCITNPATLKNQCFSQQAIFTDMTQLPKQLCLTKDCTCTFPGVKGCDPSGKESICAPYVNQAGTLVCINYIGNGAALGTGAGTASADPEHLKPPDVAQQSYDMFAPKLEIDIPDLKFIDKISAESGPNGIKRFSVPYLATYINAVYKYAIGLGVLIAIVVAMYGGMRWMTSFGNSKAIGEAKTSILNASLGLFLLMSAYTVLYVINPELPKMKALQILAPKQEVFEADDGEPGPISATAADQANNTTVQTGPMTPINSKSPLIEQLIGPFPSTLTPCTPEAADYTAIKLSAKGICVRDKNCANTVSDFMNYIQCTKVHEGGARFLPAVLDKSGWTTIILQPGMEATVPLGVLWKPSGHVGISLGGGKGQFDSGNMQNNMDMVNAASGAKCTKVKGQGVVNAEDCNKCAWIPSKKPLTGVDAQGWAKKPKLPSIAKGASWEKWVMIIVPPKYAQSSGNRGPCTVQGIKLKDGVSETLCTAFTKTWPP